MVYAWCLSSGRSVRGDKMKEITDAFIRCYFRPPAESRVKTPLETGTWMGVPFHQFVLDAFSIAEIIYETKLSVIIECGSFAGGAALFWASVMDAAEIPGIVIAVDLRPEPVHKHRLWRERVNWVEGNSLSPDVLRRCSSLLENDVMVILDSDHAFEHVRAEMEAYGNFVTSGHYMIVEDGIVNGNPILPEHGPGPLEAIEDYLKTHPEFVIDVARERKYLATFNPSGFLKRKVK